MSLNKLENPFPFFSEASDAASRFLHAQREYLTVSAELRARREATRAAYLATALVFFNIAATLGIFWITMGMHESGWSTWLVATLSFILFGAMAGLMAYLGIQAGKKPERQPHETSHIQQ